MKDWFWRLWQIVWAVGIMGHEEILWEDKEGKKMKHLSPGGYNDNWFISWPIMGVNYKWFWYGQQILNKFMILKAKYRCLVISIVNKLLIKVIEKHILVINRTRFCEAMIIFMDICLGCWKLKHLKQYCWEWIYI
jgi:hypothetical protein